VTPDEKERAARSGWPKAAALVAEHEKVPAHVDN